MAFPSPCRVNLRETEACPFITCTRKTSLQIFPQRSAVLTENTGRRIMGVRSIAVLAIGRAFSPLTDNPPFSWAFDPGGYRTGRWPSGNPTWWHVRRDICANGALHTSMGQRPMNTCYNSQQGLKVRSMPGYYESSWKSLRFGSLFFFQGVDFGEVPELFVVIESVADDEAVFDSDANELGAHRHDSPRRFVQQHAQLQ